MKKSISVFLTAVVFATIVTIPAYAEVDEQVAKGLVIAQEVKSSAAIRAAVEEDTPDADVWWDWYDKLPVTHEKYVSKSSVGSWLKGYLELSEEEKQYLNYNPLTFPFQTSATTKASTTPTGGYEHDYDPQYWEPFRTQANCYAYSLNTYGKNNYQPYPGSVTFGMDEDYLDENDTRELTITYIRTHIAELLREDGPYYNGKTILPSTRTEKPGYRQYKIACVFSRGYMNDINASEFHFFRQDSNGYWSHKRGTMSVTQLDASNMAITNPATCNRNWGGDGLFDYTIWAGYYMVTY